MTDHNTLRLANAASRALGFLRGLADSGDALTEPVVCARIIAAARVEADALGAAIDKATAKAMEE